MEKTTTCGGGDDDHLPLPLLPEDFLINILVCLPVTSLLRFKSVCKSWRDLIDSSFFIDLHTTTTINSSSSKFGTFILQATEPCVDKYEADIKLFMLSSGSGDGDGEDDDEDDDDQKKMVLKVDDLGFLPFYKDFLLTDTLRMVGSCNGIICLHDPMLLDISKGGSRHHYSNLRDVSLWNPATRQFRILPKSIPIEEKKNYISNLLEDFVAFGFDVKTKDYKVLRITPWDYRKESRGCMCRVQLPDDDSSSVLSYLGDKMAVFTTPQVDYDGGYCYFDIWVLNEQPGSSSVVVNKESWTKLHSFRIKIRRGGGEPYSEPRCISNNGEFALISTVTDDGSWRDKLQLFNLVTKEAKKDFTIGRTGTRVCRADVYKESLVSIMGGGNVLLRWQLPTHGTCYKLNLDAPFIDSYRGFGIGLCLTSDTGGCIGVRSVKGYPRNAAEGEALAILEAIKWAKELELSPIILESDSENCVSFFMDDDDDNNLTNWSSGAHSLLKEAKLLLNSSEIDISFQYCSRSCNYVADIAAKLGRERLNWAWMDWTPDFPGEIVRSLSEAVDIETEEGWAS